MLADLDLLAQWQTGDQSAGSALFRRHFHGLYRFFINKLPEEVEDLIQGTWMACLRYAHDVQRSSSFRAYLFTIARHELYRHLRSRASKAAEFGVSSIVDLSPSPSALAGSAERDRQLLGALRSLPVESQVILELFYWEDLTGTELAEVLGIPLGTAKTRLRSARRRLAEALASAEEPSPTDALDHWVRSMRAKVGERPGGVPSP